MNNQDILRHRLIKTLTAKNNDKTADTAIILWEQMATKIISIVGESGFKSLYVRSILLNTSKFSWLTTYNPKSEINNQFSELKLCFEKQTSNQIVEVNNQLLITLTDILATLIGEPLTTNILCMAWGDAASDVVTKEVYNE
ncbi:MAG: hypothetical protein ACXW1T_08470 [Methylophilus sp.]